MHDQWFIGIDGGGTKTTAVAVNAQGRFLGSSVGKGINFYAGGVSAARNELKSLLDNLFKAIGMCDYSAVFVGMSALDGQPPFQVVKDFCGEVFDPQKMEMCSDVFAGLYGLSMGKPAVMLVSGTGMMGVALLKNGMIHVTGGWGYALGDEGSCFSIGQEGLRAAIRDTENMGGHTLLTEHALHFYNCRDLRELLPQLYGRNKVNDDIAAFAREVIAAADYGDAQAGRIVQQTIDILVGQATNLLKKLEPGPIRVGMYGGLFEHNPAVFERFRQGLNLQYPNVEVLFPEISPEYGAILYGLSQRKPEGWLEMQRRIAETARTEGTRQSAADL